MPDQVVLVDEEDNITGEASRDAAHEQGLWHRVAVVYLVNDQGEVLVQHRSEKTNGKLDHSSAGHVDPNESYLEAAKRELAEELGVKDVTLTEVGKDESEDYKSDGAVIRHKYLIYKVKTNPGEINADEVQNVFWADPQELIADMQKDPYNLKYTAGFKVTIVDLLNSL